MVALATPISGTWNPGRAGVQKAEACTAAYVPRGHEIRETRVLLVIKPGGAGSHVTEPFVGVNQPSAQTVHTVDLACSANDPG
jgi:hypothetical protein